MLPRLLSSKDCHVQDMLPIVEDIKAAATDAGGGDGRQGLVPRRPQRRLGEKARRSALTFGTWQ
jgi:hypothetical protein